MFSDSSSQTALECNTYLPIPAPVSPHPPSPPSSIILSPLLHPPPLPAPSLSCRPLSRGCVWERECVREKRKAVNRMDMCPLSSTLSSPPSPLCLSSPSSASTALWAPSVLRKKESRRADGRLKTELQCQQGIRGMVVTNQKVHTY